MNRIDRSEKILKICKENNYELITIDLDILRSVDYIKYKCENGCCFEMSNIRQIALNPAILMPYISKQTSARAGFKSVKKSIRHKNCISR